MDRSSRMIRLDHLDRNKRYWPRHRLDDDRVSEFVALYREDVNRLPAISVAPYSSAGGYERFHLIDGWHRTAAAAIAGLAEIPAEPLRSDGGWFEEAVRLSAVSSKPLTRSEKREAVQRILADHPDWSNRRIAELCGVDHKTVGTVRTGEFPTRQASSIRQVAPLPPDPLADMLSSAADLARTGELGYVTRELARVGIRDLVESVPAEERPAVSDGLSALAVAIADGANDLATTADDGLVQVEDDPPDATPRMPALERLMESLSLWVRSDEPMLRAPTERLATDHPSEDDRHRIRLFCRAVLKSIS